MSVNPIVQANSLPTNTGNSNEIVGKDGFLQLLLIQMQHQDPLNPMDNQEMLSQLAQFSSLEQMSQLNENFEQSNSITSFLDATKLIGKEVSFLNTAASVDDPSEIVTKVQSVSFASEQPVLLLENGATATVDQIFRVSEAQANES